MIKLTLTDERGESQETFVESKEDIVAFSICYNHEDDKTVVYAFDSTVELFREDGNLAKEEVQNIMDDFYTFEIEGE